MLWEVAAQWAPSGTHSFLNSNTVGSVRYARFPQQKHSGLRQVRPVPSTAAQWALSGRNALHLCIGLCQVRPVSSTITPWSLLVDFHSSTVGSVGYAKFFQQPHSRLCQVQTLVQTAAQWDLPGTHTSVNSCTIRSAR